MTGHDDAPFILTALLPRDLHRWATALRTEHFPPERNYLEAHVTLFHALPPQCEDELRQVLLTTAARTVPPAGRIHGLMSLGGGTAIRLQSEELLDMRASIAHRFHRMLTQQDQHVPRLHVTIQNKVSSSEAKALQADLSDSIEPRDFAFRGLGLYRYRNGPWDHVRDFVFRG